MSETKTLEWGRTPFDELSREELMRHCQRLYMAASSPKSIASMAQSVDPHHPYWGPDGMGGSALARGEQALDAARAGYEDGDMHAAIFPLRWRPAF